MFEVDTRSLHTPEPAKDPFVVRAESGWFTVNTRSLAPVVVAQSTLFTVDTTTGSLTLRGTVVDGAGRPVAGALLSTLAEGVRRSAATSLDGRYEIASQPRGVFTITAAKDGYRSDTRFAQVTPATAVQNFQLQATLHAPVPGAAAAEDRPIARAGGSSEGRLLGFDGSLFSPGGTVRVDLPTIVMTHGWLPCLEGTSDSSSNGANGWPREFALRMRQIGLSQDKVNLLAWDWFEKSRPCTFGLVTPPPEGRTPEEGVALGKALHTLFGGDYRQPVHFIGHSLGTLVTSYAVDYLHGTSRSKHEVASPAWDSARTQVTMFDDAAIAKLVANKSLIVGSLGVAVSHSLIPYLAEASQWKDPVPGEFAYLDNYFSCVGRYHARAVNVLLQRAIWDEALDPSFSKNLVGEIIRAHGVPAEWYLQTISADPLLFTGWKGSLGHQVRQGTPGVASFDQELLRQGVLYGQTGESGILTTSLVAVSSDAGLVPPAAVGLVLAAAADSAHAIQVAEGLGKAVASGMEGLLDWMGEQASAGVEWAAGAARALGNVAVDVVDETTEAVAGSWDWASEQVSQGANAMLDTAGRWSLRIRLGSSGGRGQRDLHGGPATPGSPAYLWLPVRVPPGAQWMAFDFQIEGDGGSDALVLGINGTNRFELATRFIGRDRKERSGLIAVGDVAGQTAELFFGLVGGTAADCTLTLTGIEFRTFAPPTLAIAQEGQELVLSWPASAPDWQLEAAEAVAGPDWQVVRVPASLFAGRFQVRMDVTEATQFFRLRQ